MASASRTVFAVAAGGLLVAGLALGAGAPAQAHNYLVSSTPAEGSTVTELPADWVITTNEDLLDAPGVGAFALQVEDAEGLYYGDGCVTVTGPSMTSAAALGSPGVYTLLWQVVSSDGHTVSDEFTFTWAPAATVEASSGSAEAPTCSDQESPTTGESGSAGAGTGTTGAGQSAGSDSAAGTSGTDALWIGGAAFAVAAAALVTLLATRRRRGGSSGHPS